MAIWMAWEFSFWMHWRSEIRYYYLEALLSLEHRALYHFCIGVYKELKELETSIDRLKFVIT